MAHTKTRLKFHTPAEIAEEQDVKQLVHDSTLIDPHAHQHGQEMKDDNSRAEMEMKQRETTMREKGISTKGLASNHPKGQASKPG